MPFIISTNGLRRFESFAQALAHYHAQRDEGVNEREITQALRRKKHMRICLKGEREHPCVTMRYYSTDVVTYHDDETITLATSGYDTMSTSAFATTCSPVGMTLQASSSVCAHVIVHPHNRHEDWRNYWKNARCYRLSNGEITLARSDGPVAWEPQVVRPWEKLLLDKKRAMAALKKHHYFEFSAWALAYRSMVSIELGEYTYVENHDVTSLLAQGVPGWKILANDSRCDSGDLVRRAIYREENCVTVEKHDWLPPDEVQSLAKLERIYR